MIVLLPNAVPENRLDAASARSGAFCSLAAVTVGAVVDAWAAAVTVKVVKAPKPAASEAATSSVSVTGVLADPATKLSCDNCAAVSVVICPLGSTAPLSTQKPLLRSGALVLHFVG